MNIHNFSGKYEFLSNFAECPIYFRGLWFNTTEAAFQAAKCVYDDDKSYIASRPTPGQAKRAGRKAKMRADWEEIKVNEMLTILRLKFSRGSEFDAKLQATGDAVLVEGTTWHDQFWGICLCRDHNGEGCNVLGQTLMHIRHENKVGELFEFTPDLRVRNDWIFQGV